MFVLIQLFVVISIGLIAYFLSRDKGQAESRAMIWFAFGLGVIAFVVAGLLELHFLPDNIEDLKGLPLSQLWLPSLSIGIIEELCKFLPLAFFIYRKGYFNEHTDGIVYFAAAGVGFGLPENIIYALIGGPTTATFRLFFTSIFHAATTAFVGFYLARAKVTHRSLLGPFAALLFMILMHAGYDLGLLSGMSWLAVLSLLVTTALSVSIFTYFKIATKADQLLGLSMVATARFCQSCGYPNPLRGSSCTQCAKSTQKPLNTISGS